MVGWGDNFVDNNNNNNNFKRQLEETRVFSGVVFSTFVCNFNTLIYRKYK